MRQLPNPEIYEEEFTSTPWGRMMDAVVREVKERAPVSGALVDLMCGPGYLIRRLAEERYDLDILGVDNDSRFVDFAQRNCRSSKVSFLEEDVLEWVPNRIFDVYLRT